MNIDTSDAAFISALSQVVADNPDKIYAMQGRGCAYVHTVPGSDELCDGCLIGTVLVKMGVPREWFIDNAVNTGNGASVVLSDLGFSRRVRIAASAAQVAQDNGNSWSVAGEEFTDTYNITYPD